MEVIASIISMVVPLGRCPVSIDVHWDRGVVHPSWGIRGVILRYALSLRTGVIPLWLLLLRDESSEVFIPSKYISE